MKYWAFLSYSHTDKKWGDWLHKALETYRVPRRLVGKESRDGKVPERVYPIFRDREELPVSADLGTNIKEALEQSRYLIVICSPRSAQSRWVGEEIKQFKKLDHEDRILALIVDGEPNASDGKPGFKVEDECFHEAMRYRWADGELSEIRSEPIAADVREVGDGKTNAKLKLLAGLLGVNYDDLKQREEERRLRRARMVVATSVALIGMFAALSVALFFNARAARRARDEARATLSRSDFLQGLRSIDEGNGADALAQLVRSLRSDPKNQSALFGLGTLLADHNYAIPILCLKDIGSEIPSAEFSPDGKMILTGSSDNSARVWNAETGKVLTEPMRHREPVLDAQFSPDGKRIVTASDGSARIWDAKTGQALTGEMKHGPLVISARFSPDGKRIVTVSVIGNTARIWNAETGSPLTEPMRHRDGGPVLDAQFSPDGKLVVTASSDGTAWTWDSQTGKPLIVLRQKKSITSAQFSPDGKRVVTASYDGTAQVWDAETGEVTGEPMKHNSRVFSARFSPDGKRIVTGSTDTTARIWNAETGKALTESMKHGGQVNSAQFSPDGKRVLTASHDGTVRIWDGETGKPLTEPIKLSNEVYRAQFSPDGKWIVTRSKDNTARVWDVETGKALDEVLRDDGVVSSARFNTDGKQVVTASSDGIVRVWDAETGKALTEPIQYDGPVHSAEFSPDGKWIATLSRNTALVWNALTRKPLSHQMMHSKTIVSAQFSPDSKRLITASDDKTALVWNVSTTEPVAQPIRHDRAIRSARFSPDGTRIVTASEDATARIWDAATGRPLTESMKHGHDVHCAEFSPDGKMIVTGSRDNTARIWDAQTGKLLIQPIKHNLDVLAAQFSPDGKKIVTASGDWTARIFDARTGEQVVEPMKHAGPVQWAEFDRDGKRVLTTSNNAASLWDAETGKLLMMMTGPGLANARLSPDDRRMVVTFGDNSARIKDVSPRGEIAPEWLLRLADAVAGEHLNDQGVFEPLQDSAQQLKQVREQLNHEPPDNDWATWGRWFLADRSTRTISPFSKITVPEYIEKRIKENTRESLDEAEKLAVGNLELLKRIQVAKESLPPKSEKEEKGQQ